MKNSLPVVKQLYATWRMQWVDSTLHTTSEHGVSSITTADAHTSATSSRLNWRPPADLNGLVRFVRKTNSGFCVCAITFQARFNTWYRSILCIIFTLAYRLYSFWLVKVIMWNTHYFSIVLMVAPQYYVRSILLTLCELRYEMIPPYVYTAVTCMANVRGLLTRVWRTCRKTFCVLKLDPTIRNL